MVGSCFPLVAGISGNDCVSISGAVEHRDRGTRSMAFGVREAGRVHKVAYDSTAGTEWEVGGKRRERSLVDSIWDSFEDPGKSNR